MWHLHIYHRFIHHIIHLLLIFYCDIIIKKKSHPNFSSVYSYTFNNNWVFSFVQFAHRRPLTPHHFQYSNSTWRLWSLILYYFPILYCWTIIFLLIFNDQSCVFLYLHIQLLKCLMENRNFFIYLCNSFSTFMLKTRNSSKGFSPIDTLTANLLKNKSLKYHID